MQYPAYFSPGLNQFTNFNQMRKLFVFLLLAATVYSCGKKSVQVESPNGQLRVQLSMAGDSARYSVIYKGDTLVRPSALGFRFREAPPLEASLALNEVRHFAHDSTWTPVWGARNSVRNHYHGMLVKLKEQNAPHRSLHLIFRVYNDGIGFRYVFPEQSHLNEFEITSEQTEFRFAGDYTTWWQVANYDSYEYTFAETPLSELGAEAHLEKTRYGAGAFGEAVPGAANTPVTMKTGSGIYLSLHEADLTGYAGMTVARNAKNPLTLQAALVPWPGGTVKVKGRTPHETPWRTLQITEDAGKLIESSLIQNLNDPNALADTDWIRPGKYCGVWWSLHLGKKTWHASPRHGATTGNVLRYINFAGENNMPYVLAEGWNKYGTLGAEGGALDFITPAQDFDLEKILDVAAAQGVTFMAYNETGCQVNRYRAQWDSIFAFYEQNGIAAIKAGHVGDRLDEKYHHHSQWGVRYYQELIEQTAKYHIGLMVHEPVKPTGKVRTYPHYLTREGVAGMEQDKFAHADPREHAVEVPFTRMLAGPLDYMPGIFDNKLKAYDGMQVQSTVARQLAYYPVFLSGLKSVTDMPENYSSKAAFQFIREVPVSWDVTKVLHARIGDYLTIARKKGTDWYLGSLTDENARSLSIPLDFLSAGTYEATIYADATGAHAVSNPDAVQIRQQRVTPADTLHAVMVSGGGQAVGIKRLK